MSESPLPSDPRPGGFARRSPLTRRRLLGARAAPAAGAIAPGLFRSAKAATTTAKEAGHSAALRALGRTSLRKPGSRPFPRLPAGTDTLPGIKHIVVLMMENHSFDNIFGMLGRGDGFTLGANGLPTATNPYPNGKKQHAFRMPTTCQLSGTPSQEWLASHNAYAKGRMDGFVRSHVGPGWTGSTVKPGGRGAGTIFNRLDHYGISWDNYVATYPTGATPELFPLNDAVPEQLHHKALADFFTDAASGKLPAFSFLDPNCGTQSQENPQNIVVGEALIAKVVHAIGASPLWLSTLFVLMYDEHGGYYDHLPPPSAIPPDFIGPIVQPGSPRMTASPATDSGCPPWWCPPTPSAVTSATCSTTTRRSWP